MCFRVAFFVLFCENKVASGTAPEKAVLTRAQQFVKQRGSFTTFDGHMSGYPSATFGEHVGAVSDSS